MLTITRLSTIAAVLISGAIFTTNADAGSCWRSYRRSYVVPTRPATPPATQAPSAPGAVPPGGASEAAGQGAAGQGAAGQGAAGQGAAGQGTAAQGQGQADQSQAGQGQAGQGQAGQGQAGQGQDSTGKPDQTTTVNVPVGATVSLPGNRGAQMGEVNLVLNNIRLPLNILDWNENGITVTLPAMQITSATQAQIEIKRPGSSTADSIAIQLEPQPTVLVLNSPVVVPTAPSQAEGAPAPAVPPQEALADN